MNRKVIYDRLLINKIIGTVKICTLDLSFEESKLK